jgi:hypothetical protein
MEYQIRIDLTPYKKEERKEPYFWSIFERNNDNESWFATSLYGFAMDSEKAYRNGFNVWCEKYGKY